MKLIRIIFLSFLSINAIATEPIKIVKLTPPVITRETISEKIYCDRPMRDGKFNISVEQKLQKTIVNCYGHGGSGWTTLFGSVNEAIRLFEENNPRKEMPIRIVGSGCTGLTSAIELARRGYKVAGISTKELHDIPSWRAAGYFALVSVKTSAEEQKRLNAIGLDTFKTYQTIEREQHPYITKNAITLMPVYCSIDTEAGVEYLEEVGMIPPKEYVTLDFGKGVLRPGFIKYMTYFMETTSLMRQLTQEVKKLNIPIRIEEVKSFDEITEPIIFNCSGLASRELNKDEKMVSVRGHLVTLNEKAGTEHMKYMIYTKVKQDGKDEYIYLFPKATSVTSVNQEGKSCHGVLGGTFITNVDALPIAEQRKFNNLQTRRLWNRNSQFFHGHEWRPTKRRSKRDL